MKTCTICGIQKGENEYYKSKQVSKSGIVKYYSQSRCKVCHCAFSKDPDQIDKIARKRQQRNKTPYGKYLNFKNTKRVFVLGEFSFEKFQELLSEKCCYCNKDRPNGTVSSKDRSKPLCDNNVVPVCKSCNIRKAKMLHDKFIKRTSRLYGKTPEQKEQEASFIGLKFGKLTVTAISNRKKSAGRMYYTCLCDCGISKDVRIDSLQTGDTLSCGCIRGKIKDNNQKFIPKVLDSTNKSLEEKQYNKIKWSAKGRNLSFEITKEDYTTNYYNKPCHYCGTENCVGLDRIDSLNSYKNGNIVSCCKICNSMKNILSQQDFISHIKKIIKNMDDK
jgi:hypothetical protein